MIPVPLAAAYPNQESETSAGQYSACYDNVRRAKVSHEFVNADVDMSAHTCESRSPPNRPTDASLDALIGDWISSEGDRDSEGDSDELRSGSDSGCAVSYDPPSMVPALSIGSLLEGGATHEPGLGVAQCGTGRLHKSHPFRDGNQASNSCPADNMDLIPRDSGSFSAPRVSNTCSTWPWPGRGALSDPLPSVGVTGGTGAPTGPTCISAASMAAWAGSNTPAASTTAFPNTWPAIAALGWSTRAMAPPAAAAAAAAVSPWDSSAKLSVLTGIAAAAAPDVIPFSSGPPGPPVPRFHSDPTNGATLRHILGAIPALPLEESFIVGEPWRLQQPSCESAVALGSSPLPEDSAGILLLTGALPRCATKPALPVHHPGAAPRTLTSELVAAIARLEASMSVMDTLAPPVQTEGGLAAMTAEGWTAATGCGGGTGDSFRPVQSGMALPGHSSSPAVHVPGPSCFRRQLEPRLLQQGIPPSEYAVQQLRQFMPPLNSEQQALLGLQLGCTPDLGSWDSGQWHHHHHQHHQL
ncbi:hypothetical protein Vafri_18643 [Volvox africanus]|uniref:Uncharacterized protein n=1 Tax=Volvox africanus TaxID=51714 RepID=A0A8J4BMX0_9CHLO|nr:hypothetical protein Vafri_18643 [Volvox africanus]